MTTAPARSDTDTVTELFPAIELIEDPGLRARVAAAWLDALRTGNAARGWSAKQLRAIPFSLKAEHAPMGFVEHLNCCAEQCAAIAEVVDRNFLGRIPIDRDVLIAGALLADIGKLFEYELDDHGAPCVGERGRLLRHPFIGVSLCERHGLPDEVAHIVATHSHEGDLMQRSVEAIIFHHADFIDFDIARLLDRGARP